ncbi:hypothetical protein TD95_000729 [Thielaviopsis punctulata]|uniref:Uncharacterized protein n=1 Tax=Thielaviopsis punctulata TaxID=72032 RepID=A0A0F4ZK06_9PEZI|nr:hypothetical protein TD95_000729 [Thielaviopsis punctulata]
MHQLRFPTSKHKQTNKDQIVALILRRPGFHRAVGKIQRSVDDLRYGRNPDDPIRPGEATAEQSSGADGGGFLRHFIDELKKQAAGKPTDIDAEERRRR